MESQKIINLLEQSDDDELKFETKNGISLMIKTMVSMVKEIKMDSTIICNTEIIY